MVMREASRPASPSRGDQGADRPRPVTRRTALRGLTVLSVGVATGAFAYGSVYERHRLALTRADLPVSGLPERLAGLRIGFLTDIHLSAQVPAALVAHAVALVVAERPDLIVLGGDFITDFDHRYAAPCAELLAPLTAPHGVYAVLGNHDDDREVPRALQARSIEVLKDARTRVVIGSDALELVGVGFWTRRVVALSRLLEGARDTTILLAHDPRRFFDAAALDVGLVLSGHTHGGQVVLPVVGALVRSRFPVLQGIARRHNTVIFVSRGVGTVYMPVRINCPPEVALLTLRRRGDL